VIAPNWTSRRLTAFDPTLLYASSIDSRTPLYIESASDLQYADFQSTFIRQM
jgi:hypothetical protein